MQEQDLTYFISCDWGTTRLRLKLADRNSLDILGEVDSDLGIAAAYQQWLEGQGQTGRTAFYADLLKGPLEKLESRCGRALRGIPIICSGMASSSLGIREEPYATLPFATDGATARIAALTKGSASNPVYLISGVKSDTDVMRGEETELVGLHQLLPEPPREYLAIIPGTHSKHIEVSGNMMRGFNTFMTGELFKILLTSSTLGHSVMETPKMDWNSFCGGIDQVSENGLLKSLFRVRVNELLEGMAKDANYAFLSGLLIGEELTHLKKREPKPVLLMGNSELNPLYKTALRYLGLEDTLAEIPVTLREKAVLQGQIRIYEKLKKTV